ncbi:hypothetical protein TNCV_3164381 [Trichonephila clavipes]|nr:hypothetical protein TNCV_3164381 [Trichonephila clavipes]
MISFSWDIETNGPCLNVRLAIREDSGVKSGNCVCGIPTKKGAGKTLKKSRISGTVPSDALCCIVRFIQYFCFDRSHSTLGMAPSNRPRKVVTGEGFIYPYLRHGRKQSASAGWDNLECLCGIFGGYTD